MDYRPLAPPSREELLLEIARRYMPGRTPPGSAADLARSIDPTSGAGMPGVGIPSGPSEPGRRLLGSMRRLPPVTGPGVSSTGTMPPPPAVPMEPRSYRPLPPPRMEPTRRIIGNPLVSAQGSEDPDIGGGWGQQLEGLRSIAEGAGSFKPRSTWDELRGAPMAKGFQAEGIRRLMEERAQDKGYAQALGIQGLRSGPMAASLMLRAEQGERSYEQGERRLELERRRVELAESKAAETDPADSIQEGEASLFNDMLIQMGEKPIVTAGMSRRTFDSYRQMLEEDRIARRFDRGESRRELVSGRPNATERGDLQQAALFLDQLRLAKDRPESFGPIRGRLNTVARRFGKSEDGFVKSASQLQFLASQFIYLMTGKQLNQAEMVRLQQVLPNIWDSKEAYREALENIEQIMRRKISLQLGMLNALGFNVKQLQDYYRLSDILPAETADDFDGYYHLEDPVTGERAWIAASDLPKVDLTKLRFVAEEE